MALARDSAYPNWEVVIMFHLRYLCKCKILIPATERIDKKGLAVLKNCRGIPLLRSVRSKTGEEMNTTQDRLYWDDTGMPLAIPEHSRYLVHMIHRIWCDREWGEPFDVCKMIWRVNNVGLKHQMINLLWDLEYYPELCYLVT